MRAGGGCDGGARLDISDTMWTELAHVPRLGQVTLVLLSRQWVTFGGGATRLSPTKSGAVPQAGLQGTGLQGTYRWTGVLEMPWSGRCFSGPGVGAVDAVDTEGVCGAGSSGAGCPTGAFFPDEVPRAGWAGPGLVWKWRWGNQVSWRFSARQWPGTDLQAELRVAGGEWRAQRGAWMGCRGLSRLARWADVSRLASLQWLGAWCCVALASQCVRCVCCVRGWLRFGGFGFGFGAWFREAPEYRERRGDGAGDVPLAKG